MKPKKLKKNIPLFPEEWLEYQEHRERWDPKIRPAIDQRIRESSPITPQDRKKGKPIREHHLTSHWKKPA